MYYLHRIYVWLASAVLLAVMAIGIPVVILLLLLAPFKLFWMIMDIQPEPEITTCADGYHLEEIVADFDDGQSRQRGPYVYHRCLPGPDPYVND